MVIVFNHMTLLWITMVTLSGCYEQSPDYHVEDTELVELEGYTRDLLESNAEMPHLCRTDLCFAADTRHDLKGHLHWPEIQVSQKVSVRCPFSVFQAQFTDRVCGINNSTGVAEWQSSTHIEDCPDPPLDQILHQIQDRMPSMSGNVSFHEQYLGRILQVITEFWDMPIHQEDIRQATAFLIDSLNGFCPHTQCHLESWIVEHSVHIISRFMLHDLKDDFKAVASDLRPKIKTMLAELPLQLQYNTSNMSIITDNIAVYSFNNASYQEEQVGIIIKDKFHEDQTIDAHTNMAHLEEVVLDFGSVRSDLQMTVGVSIVRDADLLIQHASYQSYSEQREPRNDREDNARDREDRLCESGFGSGNNGISQGNMSAPNNTPGYAANQEGNTVEKITANHGMENEDNIVTTASDVVTEFEPFTGPFVGGAGNPDNIDNISPVTETFNLVPGILEDLSYDGTDQFLPGSGGQDEKPSKHPATGLAPVNLQSVSPMGSLILVTAAGEAADVTVSYRHKVVEDEIIQSVHCMKSTRRDSYAVWSDDDCTVDWDGSRAVCQCEGSTGTAYGLFYIRDAGHELAGKLPPGNAADSIVVKQGDVAAFLGFQYIRELEIVGTCLAVTSLICLVLTLASYVIFRKCRKGSITVILLNLVCALLLLSVLLLSVQFSSQVTTISGCTVTSVLRYYLVFVTLMWNATEAFNMYLMLVRVYNSGIERFGLKAGVIAWGVPAIMVGICLAVNQNAFKGQHTLVSEQPATCVFKCELRPSTLYYAYIIPMVIVIVHNFIVFAFVLRAIMQNGKSLGKTKKKSRLVSLTGAVATLVLLGVPWLFSAFGAIDATKSSHMAVTEAVFQAIFVVFVNLQGVFIFIFHCARNPQMRKSWSSALTTSSFYSRESGRGASSLGGESSRGTSSQAEKYKVQDIVQKDSDGNGMNTTENSMVDVKEPAKCIQ